MRLCKFSCVQSKLEAFFFFEMCNKTSTWRLFFICFYKVYIKLLINYFSLLMAKNQSEMEDTPLNLACLVWLIDKTVPPKHKILLHHLRADVFCRCEVL